jgi:hypothetical protein
MGPGGESPIRISLQFDHGELQLLRSGFDDLFVLGPKPGGLGQRGTAGSAVDEDGGQGFGLGFGWFASVIGRNSLNRKDPKRGPGVLNANEHANAITRWVETVTRDAPMDSHNSIMP